MRTIDIEAPKSGAKLAVMYKMGVLPELFETKEKALEVIERYPVLISQLDEEYLSDRETILTYVKSNLAFLDKYYSLKAKRYDYDGVDNELFIYLQIIFCTNSLNVCASTTTMKVISN